MATKIQDEVREIRLGLRYVNPAPDINEQFLVGVASRTIMIEGSLDYHRSGA